MTHMHPIDPKFMIPLKPDGVVERTRQLDRLAGKLPPTPAELTATLKARGVEAACKFEADRQRDLDMRARRLARMIMEEEQRKEEADAHGS